MANYGLNINLMGFNGAFKQKFKNELGEVFECVCIPIKKNRLVESKKHEKNLYANINALENRSKLYFTHTLVLKDEDNSCTEEKQLATNVGTMKKYN